MSAASAAGGAESLRSLGSKLLPLAHPLSTKLQLVRTQTARILAAAPPQELHALVDALCALGDEWSTGGAAGGGAPAGDSAGLQSACGAALLAAVATFTPAATPGAQSQPSPPTSPSAVRALFALRYSRERLRSLLPSPPWHQDGAGGPLALRLLALLLRLLAPLLPAPELTARAHAIRDAMRFLCPEHAPVRALIPHAAVEAALAQLWTAHPAACPEPDRMRFEVAVRWLCLLPSAPSKAEAQRVQAAKEALVQLISQPWQRAAGAAPSVAEEAAADKHAMDTLETVFSLLMGAPLLASEGDGQPCPPPSVFLADLVRCIPVHFAAAIPAKLAPYVAALAPAVLLPPAAHPSHNVTSAAPAAPAATAVVGGAPTESNLVAALLSMIEWGLDGRITPWVGALVDCICLANKFKLLRHFAQTYAHSFLVPQLADPATRPGAFLLLRKLLLGDQNQPAAFLSCVGGFVRFTHQLTSELQAASFRPSAEQQASTAAFLRSHSLLLRALMYCFTGHPAEYMALVPALKEMEATATLALTPRAPLRDALALGAPPAVGTEAAVVVAPSERDMQLELKQGAWSSAAALSSLSAAAAAAAGPALPAVRAKSSTGRTGLDNLGNSCFMNSCLQSLYVTDSFRAALLRLDRARLWAPFLRNHPILLNVQSVFGFLLASHRGSYAPAQLHRALPQMFRDASQQDAGEFAKYVLDVVGNSLQKLKEFEAQRHSPPPAAVTGASAAAAAAFAGSPPPTPHQATLVADSDLPTPYSAIPMVATTVATRNATESVPRAMDSAADGVRGGHGPQPPLATLVPDAVKAPAAVQTVLLLPAASPAAATAAGANGAGPASGGASTAAGVSAPARSASTNIDIFQDEFFGGQLLSELTCSACGTCSSKREPFLELPLALEIEEVQQPAAATVATATPAAAALPASATAAIPTAAPAALNPALVNALQLVQADADAPLTDGAAPDQLALEGIGGIVSSFLQDDATGGAVPMDVGTTEIKVSDGGAAAPAAAAAAPNDAASLAASCMLAMAAQTMVTAASAIPLAAAAAAAASSSSSAAAPPAASSSSSTAARSTPPPTHVVPAGPLHLSSMLSHYFQPEVLSGSNAYYCSRCAAKQTATKRLSVLTPSPQHLLICLKRNTYEFKQGQLVKNKIMKEVKYPCVLKLPVLAQQQRGSEGAAADVDAAKVDGHEGERKGDDVSPGRRNLWQTYVLYSVIVHSGTSAQRGHYYNISRQSDDEALAQLATVARLACPAHMDAESQSADVDPELERVAQGGRWCQYNDSTVTASSFAALADLTDTLPSDVAYLLFYRSIESLVKAPRKEHAGAGAADAATAAQAPAAASASSLPGLDTALYKAVQADNHVYMQSLQQAAALQTQLSALEKNYASKRTSNPDDKPSDAEFDSDMS